jgi:hypothetical protein
LISYYILITTFLSNRRVIAHQQLYLFLGYCSQTLPGNRSLPTTPQQTLQQQPPTQQPQCVTRLSRFSRPAGASTTNTPSTAAHRSDNQTTTYKYGRYLLDSAAQSTRRRHQRRRRLNIATRTRGTAHSHPEATGDDGPMDGGLPLQRQRQPACKMDRQHASTYRAVGVQRREQAL